MIQPVEGPIHDALREALHALETSQGLWVTDVPVIGGRNDGRYVGHLIAAPATYWQQFHAKPIAMLRAVLGT